MQAQTESMRVQAGAQQHALRMQDTQDPMLCILSELSIQNRAPIQTSL
jgi:hypothetical protein